MVGGDARFGSGPEAARQPLDVAGRGSTISATGSRSGGAAAAGGAARTAGGTAAAPTVDRPFPEPPAPGEAIEVAPGILWMKFDLPFVLNHVNIYALDDGDGWAIVDTGVNDPTTQAAWEAALAGPLAGRRVTRLIVTHHHPDHIGLAGWLTSRFDVPLYMTEVEYLTGRLFMSGPEAVRGPHHREFYRRNGLSAERGAVVLDLGHHYMELVSGLPAHFVGLEERLPLVVGGRTFEVLAGGGHSPAMSMLYCRDEAILLAADQVLEKISPNVSVHAMQPEADPLSDFLGSLARLRETIPDETLVLPGHRLPLGRLHGRIDQLADHHAARCETLVAACTEAPQTVASLVPALFGPNLDPHQTQFAFTEALAHANYLVRRGTLTWIAGPDDTREVVPVSETTG